MSEDVKYVGFWARTLAALIDTIWLFGILYTILYLLLGAELFRLDAEFSALRFAFEYLIPIAVIVGFWIWKSATPGKMLLGMKIVDAETFGKVSSARLVLRYLGYFVSTFPLLLGLFWVGWDKRKQGWHDKIARTVVIKTSALENTSDQ